MRRAPLSPKRRITIRVAIADTIAIPEHELKFMASRSSGPGGQNVNKVNSRVTLQFNVAESPSLSEAQKQRILSRLATRVNEAGVLQVVSQTIEVTYRMWMNQTDQHHWMKLLLNSQFFEKRMEIMSQTTLEMTKELVIAQIETKALSPDDVQTLLCQTHAVLMKLRDQETCREVVPESMTWEKSVTRHTITCLECGVPFKQLSGRHLKRHGLNARSYRAKYNIPWTQPLAAKDTTTRRKQLVQRIRPWENAPQFVKAQQRKNRKATERPKRARTKRAGKA